MLWIDAGLKMGWQEADMIVSWMLDDDQFTVNTVGYLFAEDNDMVVIVQGVTDDNILNPVRIPKVNIVSMKEIANAEPEATAGNEGQKGTGEESGDVDSEGAST